MKLNGFTGTGTGKLGSSVFAVNSGKQIVRQYQPVVANPSTIAQVDNRAKLKLASQLAAAFSPIIAIPKDGLVSARNGFIKRNYGYMTAGGGVAQVSYENLQLTKGNVAIPGIVADRTGASSLNLSLRAAASSHVDKVCYIVIEKSSERQFMIKDSKVISDAGADGTFPATFEKFEGELVIYAYGIRTATADAKARFENYSVLNGQDIATLVANRNVDMSGISFTSTRGTTLLQGEDETTSVPDGSARVFVTASGPGTATGAGIFVIGSQVTVNATPDAGMVFQGWYRNGGSTRLSAQNSYTFELVADTDLVARFGEPDPGQIDG